MISVTKSRSCRTRMPPCPLYRLSSLEDGPSAFDVILRVLGMSNEVVRYLGARNCAALPSPARRNIGETAGMEAVTMASIHSITAMSPSQAGDGVVLPVFALARINHQTMEVNLLR
jgi:hypothetical protein